MASEAHLSPSKSLGDDVTMPLETPLTPPTSPENVSMASEVHLTFSSHGNVITTPETLWIPSTSGISNTYSLGTQVKLPKLHLVLGCI